ncbi:energy-coupling factor transporter transmembrane component T family protein [Agromyces sp. MMS24-JH15]|uniref:energy-coupling factor transporter transmembrane component T family protein n=1 Tax=Agromyces sp. MMS24-JH15 TaxID=3243765 RepID=UPI003748CF98
MIGAYVPGRSPIHALPAGAKLAGLAASVVVVAMLPGWPALLVADGVVLLLFAVARIPARVAVRQLVPLAWILLLAAPLNWLVSGWESALTMSLRVSAFVLLASLVSLTTPVAAMLDAMQRALGPIGRATGGRVDPDRVGLAIAMAIRALPIMAEIVREVVDARRARGVEHSLRAIAVPVVVRALRTADAMGEALIARGADD